MKRLQGQSLAFIGVAIILPHLVALGYHPFSLEVLALSLIGGALLFAVGFISHGALFLVLISTLVSWFADSFFVTISNPYLVVAGLILFFYAVGRFSKTVIPVLAMIYAIGFTVPAFFDFPDPVLSSSGTKNVRTSSVKEPDYTYLHIILDEVSSPLGLPESGFDPGESEAMLSDYQSAGFMVHGMTMSEGGETIKSLGGLFGLSKEVDNYEKPNSFRDDSFVLKENRLIKALYDQGFDVSVIQSDYLELCPQELVVLCETHTFAGNMSIVARSGRSAYERLAYALAALHGSYLSINHYVTLYADLVAILNKDRDPNSWRLFSYLSRPAASTEILRDVSQRVLQITPGQALIAHVIFPHTPWVLDSACEMKWPTDWAIPPRFDRSAEIDKTYAAYLEQAECAHSLVMDIIEGTTGRDDMIIIVHGDHGPRIAFGTPLENPIDVYGTFLAIKAPGVAAGLSTEEVSLQAIFNDYFNSLFVD